MKTDVSRPRIGRPAETQTPPKHSIKVGSDRIAGTRRDNLWQVKVAGPQVPGLVSATTLFAGLLLVLTPFLWAGSGNSSGWTAAEWNAVIAGIAVTSLGLIRLTQPLRLAIATGIGGCFGGWLLVAPLFLDYDLDSQSIWATNVQVLMGVVVVLATILGHFHALALTRAATDSSQKKAST